MGCCRGPTRFEFVRRTDGFFFSFIPSSAFVFSYLVIPSPSLRPLIWAPGAYDLQYVPSYLPILSESRALFHLPVLLRAVTVLFTIPILPLNVFFTVSTLPAQTKPQPLTTLYYLRVLLFYQLNVSQKCIFMYVYSKMYDV